MASKKYGANDITVAFITTLQWYAKKSAEIDQDFIRAKSELNRQFNAKMAKVSTNADRPNSETVS